MKFRMLYSNYSREAMEQVVEQAPGTPFTSEGVTFGKVIKAEIIDEDTIGFEVEMII